MIGSKSATILSRKLSTPTFSMHKKSEFLSWVVDPWTEVSNGSMFPVHLAKLEILPRIGLKTPLLTPGVSILLWFWIAISDGVQLRVFLSTPALFHAKPITNAFNVFVLSGDKLLRESSTRKLSSTFMTWSFPMNHMTAGSKSPTLTDNFWTLLKMWVSANGSFIGSTCLLESLIVSTCSSDS